MANEFMWDSTTTASLDLQHLDAPQGIFGGYAAKFGVIPFAGGYHDEVILARGAFRKTLLERKKPFPVLWNHDRANPIGKTLEISEDSIGLRFQAQLNLDLLLAKDVFSNIRAGVVDEMSIGFSSVKDEEDGKKLTIKEARLFELSPVSIAANPEATINEVMSAYDDDPEVWEKIRALLANEPLDSTHDAEPLIQEAGAPQLSAHSLAPIKADLHAIMRLLHDNEKEGRSGRAYR